jgi:uncharacterized protein (TIGR02117 family)
LLVRLLARVALAVAVAFGGPAAAATVHVVSNGWHAGIVIARADLGAFAPPEAEDFPDAPYLEFGWGDRDYYPNPRPSVADAIAAGATPSPAVLHLAPRAAPPRPREGVEVVAIDIDDVAAARLARALSGAFDRPVGGRAQPIADGLYPDSLFYPATGRFHLFNTCNTWVARQLEAAGLPVSPSGIVRASELMARLRPLAAPAGG